MKILFTLLFAVFVVGPAVDGSVIPIRPHHRRGPASADGLTELAQDAVDKLKKFIMDNIDDAIGSLENIKKDIVAKFDSLKQEVMNMAMEQIDKIIAQFENEIVYWKDKAGQFGIDVKGCYDRNEPKLLGLPKLAFDKMLSCITDEYDTAMVLINGTEKLIEDTIGAVNKIQDTLKRCGSWDFSCYYDVISQCASLTITLVSDITAKVTQVTTFVAGMKARLELCAATQVTAITLEATTIATDVIGCIKDKLPNSKLSIRHV